MVLVRIVMQTKWGTAGEVAKKMGRAPRNSPNWQVTAGRES